ncbi:hypothetical protein R1sor_016253 [Riccia sorocarpa]|uniref:Uncharacterized protein n=1 Tax=Riccia sorocarpa TaxID=122646 RepID=A0ABD3HKM8_9MARC
MGNRGKVETIKVGGAGKARRQNVSREEGRPAIKGTTCHKKETHVKETEMERSVKSPKKKKKIGWDGRIDGQTGQLGVDVDEESGRFVISQVDMKRWLEAKERQLKTLRHGGFGRERQ